MPLSVADPSPRALIEEALEGAGFEPGRFASRGIHGEYFNPAIDGFRVESKRDWDWEWVQHQKLGHVVIGYGYLVDHVGKGRNKALAAYLEALTRAGVRAEIAPLRNDPVLGRSKKTVVWIDGIYDNRGFLIEGVQPRAQRRPK